MHDVDLFESTMIGILVANAVGWWAITTLASGTLAVLSCTLGWDGLAPALVFALAFFTMIGVGFGAVMWLSDQ